MLVIVFVGSVFISVISIVVTMTMTMTMTMTRTMAVAAVVVVLLIVKVLDFGVYSCAKKRLLPGHPHGTKVPDGTCAHWDFTW